MARINLTIERNNGETFFSYNISPEIEAIFKKLDYKIRKSENWPDNEFYFIPSLTENPEYKAQLDSFGLFDDFGSVLIDSSRKRMNIAWLRTVGGAGRVKIANAICISLPQLSSLISRTNGFLKTCFPLFLQNCKINSEITVEI